MSFSLSQIKRKNNKSNNTVKLCLRVIEDTDILTTNVKMALKKYVRFRFKNTHISEFNSIKFGEMVVELLSNCCDKEFENITQIDVLANEQTIIYNIKLAFEYRKLDTLYCDYTAKQFKSTSLSEGKKNTHNKNNDMEELLKYFKELKI